MPGVGQWNEIRNRVRGDPDDNTTWSVPDLPPPSADHTADIYRAAGLPPALRPYADAVRYAPLSVRHLRLLFAQRLISFELVQSALMDSGISPGNSLLVAQAMQLDRDGREAGWIDKYNQRVKLEYVRAIRRGYAEGGYADGYAQTALQNVGFAPADAANILRVEDTRSLQGVIDAVVKRARSDWMAGRTDSAGAFSRLTGAGVNQRRATLYVQEWQATRGEGHVVLAMAKVLHLLRKGFISLDDAVERLENLNVSGADQTVLLAEVAGEIAADAVKQERAAMLDLQRRIAEQNRIAAKQQAAADKLVNSMKRDTPVSQIRRWVARGLWSPDRARSRLAALGYDRPAIEAMLSDWALEREGVPLEPAKRAQQTLGQRRAFFPIARISGWVVKGIWTIDQLSEKLVELAYPQAEIDGIISDVQAKLDKAAGKKGG